MAERRLELFSLLRQLGVTYREIGLAAGTSGEAVIQALHRRRKGSA
jgi:CRP-like cAMP-binding protein